ncbi:MAG TPA: phenylalanine--tRNA ligase subunit alpha, partial [Thermoanaerobaculia bacterium]
MTGEPGPIGPADDPISNVLASFAEEAARGVASRSEFEALKGRYLGREKGLVPALFARMREIPPPDRAAYGARANAAKREVEEGIARLGESLAHEEARRREL